MKLPKVILTESPPLRAVRIVILGLLAIALSSCQTYRFPDYESSTARALETTLLPIATTEAGDSASAGATTAPNNVTDSLETEAQSQITSVGQSEATQNTKAATTLPPKTTPPKTTSTITTATTQSGQPIDPSEVNSVRFAEVLGEVLFVKGSGQQWFKAVAGMQLNLKDTLSTEAASEADLDVDADKHVLVGEEVRMVVDDLLKEVGKSKVATLRVDSGAVYVRIQRKLGAGESFEVITPTSIMGVRGTHFVVEVVGGDTAISVIEGTVEGQLIKQAPVDGPKLSESQLREAQQEMPRFTIKENQRVAIALGVQADKGWVTTELKPEMLPPAVLKAIQRNPDQLPPLYRQSLKEAIATSVRLALAAGPTLESSRFKLSGARYVDPKTGKVYARVDRAGTLKEAIEWSRLRGGHLMTITTAREQAIAEGLLRQGDKAHYLIGLIRKVTTKNPAEGFEWVTKEPLKFTHWLTANESPEPNNLSESGAAENAVTLLNSQAATRGAWTDQNLVDIKGQYGLLCEWDSIAAVRMPDPLLSASSARSALAPDDPLAPKAGITVRLADGTTTIVAAGDPIPEGAVVLLGLEPVLVPVAIDWKTATARLFPFDAHQLSYTLFMRQALGDGIEALIGEIGVGGRLGTGDKITWSYTDGLRQLSAVTVSGKIVDIRHKQLAVARVEQSLVDAALQQRLAAAKHLKEVEALLGVKGIVERRALQADGTAQITWLWTDARGAGFAATCDEDLNILATELRGGK